MKRTFFAPIAVFLGLVGSMILMARSDIFTPVVQFIHTGSITPLQAGGCLLFTAAGFAACYFLLNILCGYFVPRMDKRGGVILQTRAHGGGRTN